MRACHRPVVGDDLQHSGAAVGCSADASTRSTGAALTRRARSSKPLAWLRERGIGPVVIAFLGSNLGNTTPEERSALLDHIAATARSGDGFLVSVDLDKPGSLLEACYNDPPGRRAFAEFRLTRRFGADSRLDLFVLRAHYRSHGSVVEGHLFATEPHSVAVPGLGTTPDLGDGQPRLAPARLG
jgi:L-histidine N-alpha-methyltransferase